MTDIDECDSFPGLFVCDKQYDREEDILVPYKVIAEDKIKQQKQFAEAISGSSCIIALNITASNDLKFMIVDENYEVVPLVAGAAGKWESLSEHQKIFFNPNRVGLFPRVSEIFIKNKVNNYMEIIVQKYKQSSFKIVYHSSVLERVYFSKLQHAEIYIALINFYINAYIKNLNKKQVKNRDGIPIQFKFINVAEQFHKEKSENKRGLFKYSDVQNKRYVHRKVKAWKELMSMYLKVIRLE